MGSIFGARFARAGHETVLVDVDAALVRHIGEHGVTIVRGDEESVSMIAATTDPAQLWTADAVVFFVKCYHTQPAAELARPLVGPDTIVASLQNGWGNGDVLGTVFAPEQVVVGVTYNSGTVLERGRVAHAGVGPTLVGPYVGENRSAAERLADAIAAGELEADATVDIRVEIWRKLVLNAATLPTAAMTGMNAGTLTGHADMRELVSDTAREAVAVAQALGYEIDPDERVAYIHGLLERAGPTKASMLQDVQAGRRTEIDVINGAVVRAAQDTGVPTPLNRAFVALVRGWEAAQGLS